MQLGLGLLVSGAMVALVAMRSREPSADRGRNVGSRARAHDPRAPSPAPMATPAGTLGDACGHPFVPSTKGAYRRYRLTGRADAELELRLAELRVRGREHVSTWTMTMHIPGEPIATSTSERACSSVGAQEPWFGFAIAGFEMYREQTWRWPRELAVGRRFGGTVQIGIDFSGPPWIMRRQHIVRGREPVTVPGATIDAWRVDTHDTLERDDRSIDAGGTVWVAERIGMVRAVLGWGAARDTYELLAWSDD